MVDDKDRTNWRFKHMSFKTLTCYLFLSQLRKIYGNVYSIFLGSKPVVVINGMKTIKEALVTKGIDFAGRPQDLFVNDTTQRKGKTDMMLQSESFFS